MGGQIQTLQDGVAADLHGEGGVLAVGGVLGHQAGTVLHPLLRHHQLDPGQGGEQPRLHLPVLRRGPGQQGQVGGEAVEEVGAGHARYQGGVHHQQLLDGLAVEHLGGGGQGAVRDHH